MFDSYKECFLIEKDRWSIKLTHFANRQVEFSRLMMSTIVISRPNKKPNQICTSDNFNEI